MGRPKGSKNKRKVQERVMVDSYIINNGGEGKEVPIVKKVDPFESILSRPEAKKNEEKPKEAILAAGDTLSHEFKDSFAGKIEEVIEPKKDVIYGHCNNCRLELTEDRVVKQPIEYLKNEDGSFSKTATRFSVFCKNCMKFITLIDKDAAKMLQEMIRKIR